MSCFLNFDKFVLKHFLELMFVYFIKLAHSQLSLGSSYVAKQFIILRKQRKEGFKPNPIK